MHFRISGQKINIICKTKYLGLILILDKHLTFKYHLENLESMAVKYGNKSKVKLLKRLKGHKIKHLQILNFKGP